MASAHTPEVKNQRIVKKLDETVTIDSSSSSQDLQDTQETLTVTDSTWLTDLQNKLSPAMLYIVSLAQFIDTGKPIGLFTHRPKALSPQFCLYMSPFVCFSQWFINDGSTSIHR